MVELFEMILIGVAIGAIYGLVGMGFVLIIKASQILNFSQGGMMMIMAYVFWSLSVQFHLPLWVVFALTFMIATALAVLVERLLLRPMIGQSLLSVVMMTIALAVLWEGVVTLLWQTDVHNLPAFMPGEFIKLGGVALSQEYIASGIIVAALCIALSIFFLRTKLGLALRVVAEDEQASQSLGIKPTTAYMTAWIISFNIAAVAGILFASMQSVSYTISNLGLKVFAVVLLGGLDSLIGAAVAGILVGVLENLSAWYIDPLVGGGIREIAPYIIMVVVLMIRPSGLFGSPRIERV